MSDSSNGLRKILLVEDNPINMQVTIGILNKLGYSQVNSAKNGIEALQFLKSQRVDVVLMDLSMPELDGFEATLSLRSLRVGTLNSQVPVIALTAHVMRGDREKCLEVGMNGYLSKPLDPSALDRVLAEVWRNGGSRGELTEVVEPDIDEGIHDKEIVLDYEGFVDRMMGDREIAEAILEEMDQEIIVLLGELQQLIEQGESEQAGSQAHKMKGAASNVGALYLVGIFAEMEAAGVAGDLNRLNELLPLAMAGVRELQEEIAKI